MMLALIAAVTVTISPASPTVGDRISLRFEAPVVLEPSPQYEIVEQEGARAVIRTFRPVPILLAGTIGTTGFRNLVVPVRSVLADSDDMTPAPLAPPVATPYPRRSLLTVGAAGFLAVLIWMALWVLARRPERLEAPVFISAEEQFRRELRALRKSGAPAPWAALADLTRRYLAAKERSLGAELTTTELVPRLRRERSLVEQILRQGDLEKFSLSGAAAADFDSFVERAIAISGDDDFPPNGEER